MLGGTNNVKKSSENTEPEEVVKEEKPDVSTISGSTDVDDNRGFYIVKGTSITDGSAWHIKNLYNQGSQFYEDYVFGGTITMDGTVVRVEKRIERFGTTDKAVYVVSLRGGWKITLLQSFHPEAADLKKGDNVDVVSVISGASNDWIDLYDIGTIAGEWYDGTKITRR